MRMVDATRRLLWKFIGRPSRAGQGPPLFRRRALPAVPPHGPGRQRGAAVPRVGTALSPSQAAVDGVPWHRMRNCTAPTFAHLPAAVRRPRDRTGAPGTPAAWATMKQAARRTSRRGTGPRDSHRVFPAASRGRRPPRSDRSHAAAGTLQGIPLAQAAAAETPQRLGSALVRTDPAPCDPLCFRRSQCALCWWRDSAIAKAKPAHYQIPSRIPSTICRWWTAEVQAPLAHGHGGPCRQRPWYGTTHRCGSRRPWTVGVSTGGGAQRNAASSWRSPSCSL